MLTSRFTGVWWFGRRRAFAVPVAVCRYARRRAVAHSGTVGVRWMIARLVLHLTRRDARFCVARSLRRKRFEVRIRRTGGDPLLHARERIGRRHPVRREAA